MYKFEKLNVWQEALKFIEKIYRKENIELVFNQGDLVGKLINGLIRKIKSDS